MRAIATVALAVAIMPPLAAAQVRTSSATIESNGQGQRQLSLGRQDFCALSGVTAGGFDSTCQVRKQGDGWVLIVNDPPGGGTGAGHTQSCTATCVSGLGGSSVGDSTARPETGHTAPPQPTKTASVPAIGGTWTEVDGYCAGTTWSIRQAANGAVQSIQASVHCRGGERGQWTARNIYWNGKGELEYDYSFAAGSSKKLLPGHHRVTVRGNGTMSVAFRARDGASGTVNLQRK